MASNVPGLKLGLLVLLAFGFGVPGRAAEAPVRKRALLVGINDYEAPVPVRGGREWRNLSGAVNDALALRERLVADYGFAPRDIVTLTDRAATRDAILGALEEHLVKPAGKGDIVLFYYAGHGSQVRNSRSDEPDGLDESLVPADSRLGAPDIRDKELRRYFNRILDAGARLTVILDSCHSGSAARGLPSGAVPRSVRPDPRDVSDPSEAGPLPEDRGALVLSAAQDFAPAWETRDRLHGAFSMALLRSLDGSAAGEPAEETFLQARARLQSEYRFQEPVLAGDADARRRPLFGDRIVRMGARAVVAVEAVERDGTVILQGGIANGLTVGSELRLAGAEDEVRLVVTAIGGLGSCEARVEALRSKSLPKLPEPGTLLEVARWAAPHGSVLRVWMPRSPLPPEALLDLSDELSREAASRSIRWVADPTEETPTHVLRWRDPDWELLGPGWQVDRLGSRIDAKGVLERLPCGASLFVQVPVPAPVAGKLSLGPGTGNDGVEPTNQPGEADYILTGRSAGRRLEYAWLRPGVDASDQKKTGLPVRSNWQAIDGGEAALQEDVLRLRKILAWHQLESPPGGEFGYRLAVRRMADGRLIEDGRLVGTETYNLVLQPRPATALSDAEPRYIYVFLIDSDGQSVVLYPPRGRGSVENRFPLSSRGGSSSGEISLGRPGTFEVTETYGMDTYFLLTSDAPIPRPSVLEWAGVRTRGPKGSTPLEELLSVTGGAKRSGQPILTSPGWSIEKTVFESKPHQEPLP